MALNRDKSCRQQRIDACATSQDQETEGEKQFKRLLDKQLKKDISFKELSEQTRTFEKSSAYNPLTEEIIGEIPLNEFKRLEEEKDSHEKLQSYGLNKHEIYLWIKRKKEGEKSFGTQPDILHKQLEEIEKKIELKKEEIEKNVEIRGVLSLSRREMEIESSLKQTNKRAQFLNKLVKVGDSNRDNLHPDDPRNHIKAMELELFGNWKTKKRKKAKKLKPNESNGDLLENPEEEKLVISTCSRKPITDDEIINQRLSLDEISANPKFANYTSGDINNVLYVKNLSNRTDHDELLDLFNRFGDVQIRVLTGKMHGQAFVTFSDSITAKKALETVNGFILNGKPLIIYYKRKLKYTS